MNTPNYNLKKVEYTEIADIPAHFNGNMDMIDEALTPTADSTNAPESNGPGKLSSWVSWLTNRIKAITGKTNWWDTPDTTLAEAKEHIDAAAPHSGHETPTGAQQKANTAETNAKSYADNIGTVLSGIIGSLSGLLTTVKTNIVAAINSLKSELDAHKADYESLFITNADAKNSIYRGKYLGSAVTAEQYDAISSGAFTDLYIGDYWTIGGINWRIAAFNYYRNTGDSSLSSNHITIVPDTILYTHVMNDTNITTDGYTGSKMYLEGLEQAKATINSVFGTHVLTHRKYLCNAVTDGKASAGAWFDSSVDLMNEVMVYGTMVNSNGVYGLYNIGGDKSQLPLFRLNPRMINMRQGYWLRDVVSASNFASVYGSGLANYDGASYAIGVRPAFSIS